MVSDYERDLKTKYLKQTTKLLIQIECLTTSLKTRFFDFIIECLVNLLKNKIYAT